MKRDEILDEAKRLTTGDRQVDYGEATTSFVKVGIVWGVILDTPAIDPAAVALMLSALKIIRATESPAKADNWVDLAGYAALGGEIAEGQPIGQCLAVATGHGRCVQGVGHESLHVDSSGFEFVGAGEGQVLRAGQGYGIAFGTEPPSGPLGSSRAYGRYQDGEDWGQ